MERRRQNQIRLARQRFYEHGGTPINELRLKRIRTGAAYTKWDAPLVKWCDGNSWPEPRTELLVQSLEVLRDRRVGERSSAATSLYKMSDKMLTHAADGSDNQAYPLGDKNWPPSSSSNCGRLFDWPSSSVCVTLSEHCAEAVNMIPSFCSNRREDKGGSSRMERIRSCSTNAAALALRASRQRVGDLWCRLRFAGFEFGRV